MLFYSRTGFSDYRPGKAGWKGVSVLSNQSCNNKKTLISEGLIRLFVWLFWFFSGLDFNHQFNVRIWIYFGFLKGY
jgi:hypothetical protein